MKSVKIENLSWIKLEKILVKFDTALIAIGARTKEHGPHLQLNNDYILAEKLLEKVIDKVSVLVLPTLQYGYYPAFLEYPGSVSINSEIFSGMIIDILKSFSNYGIRKFYILNTGISTLRPLENVKKEMKEIKIIYLNLIEFDKTLPADLVKQEGGTHADEMETSMMLYLAPETVKMELAVEDYHPNEGGYLSRTNKPNHTFSKTGIFGNPTLATKEKGEIIVTQLVEYIINEINTLKDDL